MNLCGVNQVPSDRRPRKRTGRGTASGHGKTCGRGHKGQRSRSGFNQKLGHEGGQMPLLRRLPKRGFSNFRFRDAWEVVNVGDLKLFKAGSVVGAPEMHAAGLVSGPAARVKVLGDGDLKVGITIRAHRFSKQASEKIAGAGGKAEMAEPAAAAS